jgi:hypothetical protein
MFFLNSEKKMFLKENKEHDGIYWREYRLSKWNHQNYLFIYLANMCGRGQCTSILSAVPFQLAIGLIPYPYVVRYIVYVYHTIG